MIQRLCYWLFHPCFHVVKYHGIMCFHFSGTCKCFAENNFIFSTKKGLVGVEGSFLGTQPFTFD